MENVVKKLALLAVLVFGMGNVFGMQTNLMQTNLNYTVDSNPRTVCDPTDGGDMSGSCNLPVFSTGINTDVDPESDWEDSDSEDEDVVFNEQSEFDPKDLSMTEEGRDDDEERDECGESRSEDSEDEDEEKKSTEGDKLLKKVEEYIKNVQEDDSSMDYNIEDYEDTSANNKRCALSWDIKVLISNIDEEKNYQDILSSAETVIKEVLDPMEDRLGEIRRQVSERGMWDEGGNRIWGDGYAILSRQVKNLQSLLDTMNDTKYQV